MPKSKYERKKKNTNQEYLSTLRMYENKYYGIFLNLFKFPTLSDQQNHFIFKRFWRDGKVAGYVLPESRLPSYFKNDENAEENLEAIFTPFAEVEWNIYDYPTKVNLVNLRGATFIPPQILKVNEEVVIGYAHKTHAPVRAIVMWYIQRIVDIENTIDTQLFTHKMPRLIGVNPEDRSRMEKIVEDIENGEHKIYVDSEDIQNLKEILRSGEFIIDKLYAYKQHVENELMTWFGINNVGLEKDERLLVDEVNANNQAITNSNNNFLDSLKEFSKGMEEVLGFKMPVELNVAPMQPKEKGEEDNENDM